MARRQAPRECDALFGGLPGASAARCVERDRTDLRTTVVSSSGQNACRFVGSETRCCEVVPLQSLPAFLAQMGTMLQLPQARRFAAITLTESNAAIALMNVRSQPRFEVRLGEEQERQATRGTMPKRSARACGRVLGFPLLLGLLLALRST